MTTIDKAYAGCDKLLVVNVAKEDRKCNRTYFCEVSLQAKKNQTLCNAMDARRTVVICVKIPCSAWQSGRKVKGSVDASHTKERCCAWYILGLFA